MKASWLKQGLKAGGVRDVEADRELACWLVGLLACWLDDGEVVVSGMIGHAECSAQLRVATGCVHTQRDTHWGSSYGTERRWLVDIVD